MEINAWNIVMYEKKLKRPELTNKIENVRPKYIDISLPLQDFTNIIFSRGPNLKLNKTQLLNTV